MKPLLLFFVTFLLTGILQAQPGTLDGSFGLGGKLLYKVDKNSSAIQSLIAKPGNKLLASTYYADNLVLMQLQENGSLDSAYGINGQSVVNFKKYAGYVEVSAITTAPDKKIVAAGKGYAYTGTHFCDIILTRLLENGEPDPLFGDSGKVAVDLKLIEYITSVAITSQGKIVVGGYCSKNLNTKYDLLLARFNADGSLDNSFGENGKVVRDIGASYDCYTSKIALTEDGAIIVAGTASDAYTLGEYYFLLAKHDADGKIDSGFGNNGLVFTSIATEANYCYDMALQNDGKISAVGVSREDMQAQSGITMVRYNGNGSLDTSFNNKGSLVIFFNDNNASGYTLALKPDGKYLLGGVTYRKTDITNYSAYNFSLASVTKDGRIDSSFGTNGLITTDFENFYDECHAIAVQPDGKIIAAGGAYDFTNSVMYTAFARYNGDESRRQILIAKIRRWLQHHNGIAWDNMPGVKSYAVQRSSNGMNWSTVYRSPFTANGQRSTVNGQQPVANRYADANPLPGTNYYRLQTTSVDGAVAYSNTIAISHQPLAVSLSPNPARNVLRIEGLSSSGKTKITVTDFAGNAAISNQLSALSSCHSINIAALKPGNYLLRVEKEGEVVTKQFVKE